MQQQTQKIRLGVQQSSGGGMEEWKVNEDVPLHRGVPGSPSPWWSAPVPLQREASLLPAPRALSILAAPVQHSEEWAWKRGWISVRGIPRLWWDHWWHPRASFLLIQKPVHTLIVASLILQGLAHFCFHRQLSEAGCVTAGFCGNQTFIWILYGFLVVGCGSHCYLEGILPAFCFSCRFCCAKNSSSCSKPKTITKKHSAYCGVLTPSGYKQVFFKNAEQYTSHTNCQAPRFGRRGWGPAQRQLGRGTCWQGRCCCLPCCARLRLPFLMEQLAPAAPRGAGWPRAVCPDDLTNCLPRVLVHDPFVSSMGTGLEEYQPVETVPINHCNHAGMGKYWATGRILWTSPLWAVGIYFRAQCDCSVAAL